MLRFAAYVKGWGRGKEKRRFIQSRYSKPDKIWIHFSPPLDRELREGRQVRQALEEPKLADVTVASLQHEVFLRSCVFAARIWQATCSRKCTAHEAPPKSKHIPYGHCESAGCHLSDICWAQANCSSCPCAEMDGAIATTTPATQRKK